MSKLIKIIAPVILLLVFCASAQAQQIDEPSRARKVLNKTAKTGVVVIGTTAKYSWKATKFTAGKVAKPAVTKASPAIGRFALKQSGKIAKRSMPVIKKFAVTYLKFRFSP